MATLVTSNVLQTVCMMRQGGLSYSNYNHVLTCVRASLAVTSCMTDIEVAVEGYLDFLREVAEDFGEVVYNSLHQNNTDISYDLTLRHIDEIISRNDEDYNGNMPWEDALMIARGLKERDKFNVVLNTLMRAYNRVHSNCMTTEEFLVCYRDLVTSKVFDVPEVYLDDSLVDNVVKEGISYKPTNLKEELAYVTVFVAGVRVAQLFNSVKGNASVGVKAIVSKVMSDYNKV